MATPNHRPRDAAATREALLRAAAPLFGEFGYEGTTVAQVARAAGFSPNLVTRYFGGKEGLFLAVTRTGLHIGGPPPRSVEDYCAWLADHIVDRWEREGQNDPLLILMRSASARPAALAALGEFLERESTEPLTRALLALGYPEPEAVDRANAMQSFILGVVVTRRMLHSGAVAAASSASLRAWLTDAFRHLIGDGPSAAGRSGEL